MAWSYNWNYTQNATYNQLERLREWLLEAGGAQPIVQGFSPTHPGVLLGLGQNSPVYALGRGTIEYAGGDPTTGVGTRVFLRLDNGWRIAYGYLADLNQFSFGGGHTTPGEHPGVQTAAGQTVEPGQLIGHSGNALYLSFANAAGVVQNPGPSVQRLIYNVFHPLGLGGEPLGQVDIRTLAPPAPGTPVNPANVATTLEGSGAGAGAPATIAAGYGTPVAEHSCPLGFSWSDFAGQCVFDPTGTLGAINGLGGVVGGATGGGGQDLLGVGQWWQGVTQQLADAGGAIAIAGIGLILIIAGIFALARGSQTVQVIEKAALKEAI